MNLDSYTSYDKPFPPGVKLPKIVIADKYYESVNCPIGDTNFNFLRHLCMHGVKEKGIDKLDNAKVYYDRLKSELAILDDLGFIDYILLNWDIIKFCLESDIPTGAGRGSAAGSLVLYVIGVTNMDPIRYDLFFERFVSKSRARKIEQDGEVYLDGSLLADIDNDIAYDSRAEVIKYINDKYKGRTAKILTLNTLSSKSCIKECGKIVEGMTESEVNDLSTLIPKRYGLVLPLVEAIKESEEFAEAMEHHPVLFKMALKLEGINKNTGVHPSGIAISFAEIEDLMPLQLTNDGELVSGYSMNDVAALSVKFDILGLRTLSVVVDVCKQVGIGNFKDIDVHQKVIYDALQFLEAPKGLFQIEADTNFRVAQQTKPQNLEQLSGVIAIARPGALDFKDKYAEYVRTGESQSEDAFFDSVLGYTGGIPLYQEQLMKMAVKIGFTLDEAEQLRRIVAKKKVDKIEEWQGKIKDKIEENGLDKHLGDLLWKVAEDSANYSFNKSHSISYANLAATTVYLKFTYPQEFFLSLLKMARFEPHVLEEIAKISQELNQFDIELLPPDLNLSDLDFSKDGKNIRYGLNCIKGVSEKTIENILEFREEKFENKYDIFLSAKQCGVNIGVLSAFIQAGILDSFVSHDRCRLVLEAQSFNVLTDREKRNIVALGEEYKYDVLDTIHDNYSKGSVGDDNKKFMTERRFKTFISKYEPYKKIYHMNREHIKFASWYFETKLLGYSYSYKLRGVFNGASEFSDLISTKELSSKENRTFSKVVGVVTECSRSISRGGLGHKYARIRIQDEVGSLVGLFMNSDRESRLDDYLAEGNRLPKKDDIVVLQGVKSDDIVFVDNIQILEDKIYMKLSEVK